MLLPTIRSRAVVLSFKSLSQEELINQYVEAGIHQYASIVAALTQKFRGRNTACSIKNVWHH